MLKKIAAVVAALLLMTGGALANTLEIGAQYGFNAGANLLWSGTSTPPTCSVAPVANVGINCQAIPAGMALRDCVGTMTIKNAANNAEVLGRLVAGTPGGGPYENLWVGEMFGPKTQTVTIPKLNPSADNFIQGGQYIWVEYQAGSPEATPAGAALEFQIVCTVW